MTTVLLITSLLGLSVFRVSAFTQYHPSFPLLPSSSSSVISRHETDTRRTNGAVRTTTRERAHIWGRNYAYPGRITRRRARSHDADAVLHENNVQSDDPIDLAGCNDNNANDDELPQDLEGLGWKPYFSKQLDVLADDKNDNDEVLTPVRITEVRSQGIWIVGAGGIDELIPNIPPKQQVDIHSNIDDVDAQDITAAATVLVGDWILVNDRRQIMQILDRRSLLQRRAPGRGQGGKIQLMAANVDTVFVVSSCNQDFNVARLERYVAMALEANVDPVIVLTKRDQWDGVDEEESMLPFYLEEASDIIANGRIPVVQLDARGSEPADKLREWFQPGETVAFLGSSGVGKSTLVNSLCGTTVAKTGDIHEDSGQGRHTTTRRQLHFLPVTGCAIMDTPGLRELQLIKASQGVSEVFADLVELSGHCAFSDCKHAGEPGCAIEAAIVNDEIDSDRFERWRKLVEEDELNLKTMTDHGRRQGESSSKAKRKKAIPKSQQKKNKKYRQRLERQ